MQYEDRANKIYQALEKILVSFSAEELLAFSNMKDNNYLDASPAIKKAICTEGESNALGKLTLLSLAECLALPKNSLDIVLLVNYLHSNTSPMNFLTDIADILSCGGYLIILEPNPLNIQGFLQTLKYNNAAEGKDEQSIFNCIPIHSSWLNYVLSNLNFQHVSTRKLKLTKNIFGNASYSDYITISRKNALAISDSKDKLFNTNSLSNTMLEPKANKITK